MKDYQKLAMRTAKTPKDEQDGMLHAAVGIGSEIGELALTIARNDWIGAVDPVNAIEEVGDVLWYIALLGSMLIIDAFEETTFAMDEAAEEILRRHERLPEFRPVNSLSFKHQMLSHYGGDIITQIKAHCYYGKPIDLQRLRSNINHVNHFCAMICEHYGYDINSAKKANIEKLQKRYPEAFSTDAAIARADKA